DTREIGLHARAEVALAKAHQRLEQAAREPFARTVRRSTVLGDSVSLMTRVERRARFRRRLAVFLHDGYSARFEPTRSSFLAYVHSEAQGRARSVALCPWLRRACAARSRALCAWHFVSSFAAGEATRAFGQLQAGNCTPVSWFCVPEFSVTVI